MDSKTYTSILKTICYADIFEYPLKEEEVELWVTGKNEDSPASQARALRAGIKRANGVIAHKNSFMFLKGRDWFLELRHQREIFSQKKIAIAESIASFLKRTPTIKLIGVSGSVAMVNADEDDDIDLFIITSRNSLWLTRLLATIIVDLLGKRRRPNDTYVADKICLNMFVDEDSLATSKDRQNLYTAHEVCQLKVLYDRDNTHQKFLAANVWVRKFLPNGIDIKILRYKDTKSKEKKSPNILISQYLSILNWLAKHLQLLYMKRHRTHEFVTDHCLFFHPKDYTQDILSAFEQRVKVYGTKV